MSEEYPLKVRALVSKRDTTKGAVYSAYSTNEYVTILDDVGDERELYEKEFEILPDETKVLNANTIEVGDLVKINHSDYEPMVQVGQMRRVAEVFGHGIEITVFASEFNSDVSLFFYFEEIE